MIQTLSVRQCSELRIAPYSAADWDGLVEFQDSISAPEGAPQYTPDRFRWQFTENPHARTDAPNVWVCKANDRVVAQIAGIPVKLKVGSRCYDGAWAIDMHVHRDFRRRGIGGRLDEACSKDSEITLGMGITDVAHRVHQRAGWIDLATVPLFMRPLDAGEILSMRWRPRLGRWLGAACDLPFLALDLCGRAARRWASIHLEEIKRFDDRADELWRRAAPHYPVVCQRDKRYLNWRFADCPRPNGYRLFYVRRRAEVVGYAVLRMGSQHGVRAGQVVDYFCEPEWTTLLFAGCLQQFRRWGAAAVYCCHASPWATAALRPLGFVRRESSRRLMVKPELVDEKDRTLLRDREKWFVTTGDSDADLPGVNHKRDAS